MESERNGPLAELREKVMREADKTLGVAGEGPLGRRFAMHDVIDMIDELATRQSTQHCAECARLSEEVGRLHYLEAIHSAEGYSLHQRRIDEVVKSAVERERARVAPRLEALEELYKAVDIGDGRNIGGLLDAVRALDEEATP